MHEALYMYEARCSVLYLQILPKIFQDSARHFVRNLPDAFSFRHTVTCTGSLDSDEQVIMDLMREAFCLGKRCVAGVLLLGLRCDIGRQ